jgi:glucosamine--fructose-6-phosphate aminotransferase (isomerizing)
MSLRAEIFEQPAVLARLHERQGETVAEVAHAVRREGVGYVYLAARGSSDHAGVYALYAWGALLGLPVALAAPSLFSVYSRPPRLRGSLVVGISQSGQSPDIVAVLLEASRQGVPTLAITNDPGSPLAAAARFVIETCAGSEAAVAATKTYTAQLMAIAMLAAALADDPRFDGELGRVPGWVEETLELDPAVEAIAERYRFMDQCVVLGRGFDYATAREWSLKLKELTYVGAEPYSPSDFRHGPVAIVESGFPVLATVARGPVLSGVRELLETLVTERGAELLAISNDEAVLALASRPLPLPASLPEWLCPLVSIVPAQLFCYHLARAKGHDTERPRGLTKVTRTV